MFEYINMIGLIIDLTLFSIFYLLSIQPMKRKEKRGDKAWRDCYIFCFLSILAFICVFIELFLWFWFPISSLNWKITSNHNLSLIIGLVVSLPCIYLWLKGWYDAGSETLKLSEDSNMYGGIYQ